MEGCKPKSKGAKQSQPQNATATKHAQEPSMKMSKMFDVAPDFYKISEVHPLPPSNGTGEPVPLDDIKTPEVQSVAAGRIWDAMQKNGSIVANNNAVSAASGPTQGAGIATGAPIGLPIQQQQQQQQQQQPQLQQTNNQGNSFSQQTDNNNTLYSSFNPMMGGMQHFNALLAQQQLLQQAQIPSFPFNQFLMAPQQLMGYPQLYQQSTPNGINTMGIPSQNGFAIDPTVLSLMQNAFGSAMPATTINPSLPMTGDTSNMNALQASSPQTLQQQSQPPNGSVPLGFPSLNGIPVDTNMLSLMQNALGSTLPTTTMTAGVPQESTTLPQVYQPQLQQKQFAVQTAPSNETDNNSNGDVASLNGVPLDPNLLLLMQNMQNAFALQQQVGSQTVTASSNNNSMDSSSSQQEDDNIGSS